MEATAAQLYKEKIMNKLETELENYLIDKYRDKITDINGSVWKFIDLVVDVDVYPIDSLISMLSDKEAVEKRFVSFYEIVVD